MKLDMTDMRARGYKVTERILNVCINYDANSVGSKGPTKHSRVISASWL